MTVTIEDTGTAFNLDTPIPCEAPQVADDIDECANPAEWIVIFSVPLHDIRERLLLCSEHLEHVRRAPVVECGNCHTPAAIEKVIPL